MMKGVDLMITEIENELEKPKEDDSTVDVNELAKKVVEILTKEETEENKESKEEPPTVGEKESEED